MTDITYPTPDNLAGYFSDLFMQGFKKVSMDELLPFSDYYFLSVYSPLTAAQSWPCQRWAASLLVSIKILSEALKQNKSLWLVLMMYQTMPYIPHFMWCGIVK